MSILRLLILFFTISSTHVIRYDYHGHDTKVLLQQNSALALEAAIPEIISLPIEFPNVTNSSQLISIDISDETPLKDKSVNEVIQNIAQSAKLRYSMDNDVIRVEQNLPYLQNYYVDFVNIQWSAHSSFVLSDNIINSNGNSTNVGSTNAIKSQYSSDLWGSLEKGLNMIMDVNGINDGEFLYSNRETGIIILNARKDIHKAIEEYIHKVKRLAPLQVMIEAKVVEVVLNDQYPSSINFNDLHSNQENPTTRLSFSDLEDLIKSLDKFGTSSVISSARVHATNNQQAMISFAENHVYFTVDAKTVPDKTLITKIKSVPIGVMLVIHPIINIDANEIFMDVSPTLSRINGYTKDPGIEYIAQRSKIKLNSNVPLIEIREMSSILKIKSGEIMVIGGFIERREDAQGLRVKRKPFSNIGAVETVVFLKATIVPSFGFLSKKKDKHHIR
ncbi:Type II/III secretion system [Cinara cedri]|uniref:Type II/III secretion system n=1 Tax=Cinara cedri TaxID=506608 RepID=A0A5E4NDN7_9HEMI|nr:Type II/III secretion system [Cinara cedri]